MPLSRQEEMQDRNEYLENEKALRGASSQGSSFAQFAASEAGTPLGRFSAISNPTVIGAEATPNYPQGPAWCSADQGLEPPFPVDISAQEPTGEAFEIARSRAESSAGSGSLQSQAPTSNPASGEPSAPPNTPLADAGLGSFSRKTYRRF
jgi:hypothetical protein